MRLTISNIASGVLAGMSLLALSSCTMMHEDYEDCPTGLYVRFVYDYNTMRADMFKDHVGHLQLYVFDENGRLAAQRHVSNNGGDAPLSRYGYTVHFNETELPAGHSYRLQAVAMQRDWDDALASEGAKYRHATSPIENSESMTITLDHHNTPLEGTRLFPVSDAAPLDTLWHTLKVIPHAPADGNAIPDMDATSKPFSIYPLADQTVRVEKEHATYATVSLIRDTKHLNLTLRQVDEPADMHADDFDVRIIDNNAGLAHDNSVITNDSVQYTPYAAWTSRLLDDNTVDVESVSKGNLTQTPAKGMTRDGEEEPGVVQRTAHYNLMFNRIIHNPDENSDNAILEIRNRETGATVAKINLPYTLAEGRMAFELQNYGRQEYLDREHDYHLDFFLKGDKWIAVEIHVLSWSKRIQNVEL